MTLEIKDHSKRANGTSAAPGYQALRERAAWLDLSARGKIRVMGEDRARLLHAMTTNHVQDLTPGEGCYAFFLNAQGRILGDANILCFADHILLDTEPDTGRKLFEHLDRYIIADDVTIEDVTEKVVTIAVEGPRAKDVLEKLAGRLPDAPYSNVEWGEGSIARLSSTGSEGYFLFVPVAQKESTVASLVSAGAVAVSPEEARIVRIEHGNPRYGEEITERYLVQETGQLQAVHFSKGCYLGQEIVERVRSRAQIHRMLRRIEIDTADAPAAGTKFKSGEADAGEIVSSAYSPALEKTVGMAYMRTPFAEPGTEFVVNGATGRVAA